MTVISLRRLVARRVRRAAATRDPDMARHPVQPGRRIYRDSFFADPAVVEDDYHRMRRRSTASP
jgi:hypothetical protein